MQNGKRHGHGAFVNINGGKNDLSYIGDFSNNKYSGSGMKLGKSLFYGSWHSGKPGGQG